MAYTRLTQNVIDRIAKGISEGCSNKSAITLAGCAESTFYLWQARGREDQARGIQSIFADLVERLAEAEASRERSLVQGILKDTTWKSKAWLLERLYPNQWGPIEKKDVTLRQALPEQPIINLSVLSMEEKENLSQMLDKAMQQGNGMEDDK
jgi:hypothetical protein